MHYLWVQILKRRDNGDRKGNTQTALFLNSTVSVFFRISQQIQKSKSRNSQQIFTGFRIVNAEIVCIFGDNNCR